jgi:agmatine deiminase
MTEPVWKMPDEAAPHRRTWMAFGAGPAIWGKLLPQVQANVAAVARAIAKFEPVTMLVRPAERAQAAKLCGPDVTLTTAEIDDLWIRDTGPTFVLDQTGNLGAVDLNFNGWGAKQEHRKDAEVAAFVAKQAKATVIESEVVGEGGGLEVDGHGTAIVTESCFLNRNRNPKLTKAECEAELKELFGLRKIIWLPGVKGKDITDGHTDFYARFARPGVVVAALDPDPLSYDHKVTKEHLRLLKAATDAAGKPLEVIVLEAPGQIRWRGDRGEFAAGYINYYVGNDFVVAPEFGDAKADARCRQALAKLFPNRTVVQLEVDAIAAGGGGIHCATQQEPLPPA